MLLDDEDSRLPKMRLHPLHEKLADWKHGESARQRRCQTVEARS